MSQPGGRPPALFPLFAAIDTLPGIGPNGVFITAPAITYPHTDTLVGIRR